MCSCLRWILQEVRLRLNFLGVNIWKKKEKKQDSGLGRGSDLKMMNSCTVSLFCLQIHHCELLERTRGWLEFPMLFISLIFTWGFLHTYFLKEFWVFPLSEALFWFYILRWSTFLALRWLFKKKKTGSRHLKIFHQRIRDFREFLVIPKG